MTSVDDCCNLRAARKAAWNRPIPWFVPRNRHCAGLLAGLRPV